MGRNRVLSFMSQLSASGRDARSITPLSPDADRTRARSYSTPSPTNYDFSQVHLPPSPPSLSSSPSPSPSNRARSNSRPLSMIQAYTPPTMGIDENTPPELQPIYSYIDRHTSYLYQEGYFLKLDDQDTNGKPCTDRTWMECFAQLVGTVLSLWDAAELDRAGDHGEVLPKFLNLTDASIKMIESLPTRSNDEQPLQNILSISTAGRNRYLFHFNSHYSLVQWTAGIRLATHVYSSLQEAYTGALIAGKGKYLNNINLIMSRERSKTCCWVRVRFGAGVPWKQCYCVISPPDEREVAKLQKELKKRSPYDRSHPPIVKGNICFYESRREAEKKKNRSRPIATITDAYSAYALYPQWKALIDQSTLIKIEGNVTFHSTPPASHEGFIFVMPEAPPAVSGFEMLLRFLMPTWDTFALYGRPQRLVASPIDPRSLMFGLPKNGRKAYLDILDVSNLITAQGNSKWSERQWRQQLREATARRMTAIDDSPKSTSHTNMVKSNKRLSFTNHQGPAAAKPRVNFGDEPGPNRAARSQSLNQRRSPVEPSSSMKNGRERAMTSSAPDRYSGSSDGSGSEESRVSSFGNVSYPDTGPGASVKLYTHTLSPAPEMPEDFSSDQEGSRGSTPVRGIDVMPPPRMRTPDPVSLPPAFSHVAGSKPSNAPLPGLGLRRANSRLSSSTLSQMAKASGLKPDDFSYDPVNGFGAPDHYPPAAPALPGPMYPESYPAHAQGAPIMVNTTATHPDSTRPPKTDDFGPRQSLITSPPRLATPPPPPKGPRDDPHKPAAASGSSPTSGSLNENGTLRQEYPLNASPIVRKPLPPSAATSLRGSPLERSYSSSSPGRANPFMDQPSPSAAPQSSGSGSQSQSQLAHLAAIAAFQHAQAPVFQKTQAPIALSQPLAPAHAVGPS